MGLKIADDLTAEMVSVKDEKLLALIVQDGYRENKSINLVGDEVTKLYEFMKKEIEGE